MPIIKEVFFKNKKKQISFLNEEEMLEKITKSLISEDDKKDPTKKEKAILEKINWFQKINIANKEFFVEKSDNPLKIKNQLVEKENSGNEFWLVLLLSVIPICILPVSIGMRFINWRNKRKIQKGTTVYLSNDNSIVMFYLMVILLANVVTIITLLATKLPYVYLGLLLANMLTGLLKFNESYINIENYDLMEFTLEEENFEEKNSVANKIRNMQSQEITVKNKKIEYDFIKDMDFAQNEADSITTESNTVNFKKHL